MRSLTAGLLCIAAACGGGSSNVDMIALSDVPEGVGAICGSANIQGAPATPIANGACGISSPVRVYAVSGVRLKSRALVNCKTANALNRWVRQVGVPQSQQIGERLTALNVVASYSCRTRNSQRGAKLSEHAKGNAIDIAAFEFESGKRFTVLEDWDNGRAGRLLKSYHRGACGIFGTVLGPRSDRFHKDHFHFDIAKYAKPYCR